MQTIAPVYDEVQRQGKADSWIDEEMAECLLASGKAAEAKPLFARAYEVQKDDVWVQQHEAGKLERMKKLAGK